MYVGCTHSCSSKDLFPRPRPESQASEAPYICEDRQGLDHALRRSGSSGSVLVTGINLGDYEFAPLDAEGPLSRPQSAQKIGKGC